jgi:hypothetical protein
MLAQGHSLEHFRARRSQAQPPFKYLSCAAGFQETRNVWRQ